MELKMSTSEIANQTGTTSDCIICGAELNFNTSLDIGEVLECYECGVELEVFTISP